MNDGSTFGGNGNGASDPRQKVEEFAREASAQVEHARMVFDDYNDRIAAFIRERPGTALLGALALGFVVGKIASKAR